jgi:hypothetical protein
MCKWIPCALLVLAASTLPAAAQIMQGIVGGTPEATLAGNPVQQTSSGTCSYSSGSSFNCVLGAAPSASDVLILIVGANSSTTNIAGGSLTPTSTGATWTAKISGVYSPTGMPPTALMQIWCATLSGSPGSTVSVAVPAGTSSAFGNVSEWSNQSCTSDPAGGSAVTSTSSTPDPGSLTTSNAPDVMVAGYLLVSTSVSLSSGPTNSFVALNTPNSTAFQAAYFKIPTNGSYDTSWTLSSSQLWLSLAKSLQQ